MNFNHLKRVPEKASHPKPKPGNSDRPTPAALGFSMPAEWAPQSAVWLSWPHNRQTWPRHFRPIPAKFAEIVARISRREKVRINLARPLQKR
ncbi:MAG TPA: agmatine deiminase family protein, partial [Opitutaceae bacterium]|nr:agmatine deiminase family protein [Opitutaceae bacterium]